MNRDTSTYLLYLYNSYIFFNLIKFRDALATTLSALYGKLLVVMGTAFPMAEVISTYVPPSFYEAYYLYLYIGSMFFLLYMYMVLLRDKNKRKGEAKKNESKYLLIGRYLIPTRVVPLYISIVILSATRGFTYVINRYLYICIIIRGIKMYQGRKSNG